MAGDSFLMQKNGTPPTKMYVGNETHSDELQAEVAGHWAASAAIQAQTNADGRVLRQVGHNVELIGDVFSLRDVIDEWAPTVDPQTADGARCDVLLN